MRNMIQLLGGVAVAGVVAAGATAFTAPGLVKGTGGAQAIAGGATTGVSIVGAKLDAVTLTNGSGTTYTDVNVKLVDEDGDPILTGTVTATVTGTTSNGATTGSAISCTASGGGLFNCPAGSAAEAWDTVTAIAVSVSDGDAAL